MASTFACILGVVGVVLAIGGHLTARPPERATPLDSSAHRDGWSELHGGLDSSKSGLVSAWLSAMHALGLPLARAGVHPNTLTLAGMWVTLWVLPLAAWGERAVLVAAGGVVLAGLLDGLDGAVAVLSYRATRWGALLDEVVDRLGDGVLLVALALLGAPGWLVSTAAAAVVALEGTRRWARAHRGGVGGRITPGERPTRLILAGSGFFAAGCQPDRADAAATASAAAVLAVCTVSWLMLLSDQRAR